METRKFECMWLSIVFVCFKFMHSTMESLLILNTNLKTCILLLHQNVYCFYWLLSTSWMLNLFLFNKTWIYFCGKNRNIGYFIDFHRYFEIYAWKSVCYDRNGDTSKRWRARALRLTPFIRSDEQCFFYYFHSKFLYFKLNLSSFYFFHSYSFLRLIINLKKTKINQIFK